MRSRPEAVGRRHAVVIGMHRSGTSATAHTLVELGLSTPDPEDLIQPGPDNERGYWESQTIVKFDERVLRHLGGTWSAPPCPSAGWEASEEPDMREIRSRASELATSMLGPPPGVLKDPRLSLTLPLWRVVMPNEPLAVLVFRDPLEVALSLQRRDGFPLTLGLALWHRYVRQSLAVVAGLPVLVGEYARILEEPHQWVDDLATFLNDHGVVPVRGGSDQASRVLSRELRHHDTPPPGVALDAQQRQLLEILRESVGVHKEWSTPELPDEPSWVDDVIGLAWAGQAVTAAMQAAQHELKWVKKSRLFRATHALWRVTGKGPVLNTLEQGSAVPKSRSNGTASAPAVSR